jgi:hypothetical protein
MNALILSQVEERIVTSDYTIRYQGKIYQIARGDIRAGLRGGRVRVEQWLDGSLGVKLGGEVSPALPVRGGVPASTEGRTQLDERFQSAQESTVAGNSGTRAGRRPA